MIGGKFIDIAGKHARPSGRPAQYPWLCDLDKSGITGVENVVISGRFAGTFTSSFPSMPNPHLRFPILRRVIVDEDGLFPGLNDHKLEPGSSLPEGMSLGQSFSTA
jgi:hypothetical protein